MKLMLIGFTTLIVGIIVEYIGLHYALKFVNKNKISISKKFFFILELGEKIFKLGIYIEIIAAILTIIIS